MLDPCTVFTVKDRMGLANIVITRPPIINGLSLAEGPKTPTRGQQAQVCWLLQSSWKTGFNLNADGTDCSFGKAPVPWSNTEGTTKAT